MTTTTATVRSDPLPAPDRADPSPLTTRFGAGAMVVGPLALLGAAALLGSVLHVETADTLTGLQGHRASAIAYVNVFLLAEGLLAFAWLRMGAIVARGNRRLGLLGGSLLAFSMTVMAAYNGIVLSMGYVVQGNDVAPLVKPFDDLFTVPNVGSLSPIFIVIGSLCLAVGAFRSGVLPKVQAVGIGLFAFVPVALLGGIHPMLFVAAAGAIVGLVPTGLRELADGRDGQVR